MSNKFYLTKEFYAIVLASYLVLFILYQIVTIGTGSEFISNNPKDSSFMSYRESEYDSLNLNFPTKYTWVNYENISSNIKKAVIAGEDGRFLTHDGIDYESLKSVVQEGIKKKNFKRGASTITMQLVKNIYFTPERSFIRKFKELFLAQLFEENLPKWRILELYLNVIEMGKGIYGIEEASKFYYNKSASKLTAYEAASIAAILPNPRKFSPKSGSGFVNRRRSIIFNRMFAYGVPKKVIPKKNK